MREYALKTIFILAMLLQLGFAQDEYGCTDPEACNYNPDAAIDDGSCLYFDCFGIFCNNRTNNVSHCNIFNIGVNNRNIFFLC